MPGKQPRAGNDPAWMRNEWFIKQACNPYIINKEETFPGRTSAIVCRFGIETDRVSKQNL